MVKLRLPVLMVLVFTVPAGWSGFVVVLVLLSWFRGSGFTILDSRFRPRGSALAVQASRFRLHEGKLTVSALMVLVSRL